MNKIIQRLLFIIVSMIYLSTVYAQYSGLDQDGVDVENEENGDELDQNSTVTGGLENVTGKYEATDLTDEINKSFESHNYISPALQK